ncbi:nitrite reductase small subunit NirD [Leeia oryzae]|uniref:nitrite reductase small subunit NirD n=1 Tax=Leeia oryzae TaxID=356662 RepID=UPI00036F3F2E|nr:nitrite reductase small subunit NirD [Leeia oryzae]
MSEWIVVCQVTDIPKLGARVVKESGKDDIAVFRTETDQVFALTDRCPHKGGPLSQGIVYGENVACPLHNWQISLSSGEACAPDEGCAGKHPVKVEGGTVYLLRQVTA